MKETIASIVSLIMLVTLVYLGGCNYTNVSATKENASKTFAQSGFEIVGYEGYQIGDLIGSPGGKVWYIVKRSGEPSVIYHCYLSKWGDEYHIYGLESIDAIKPSK